MVQQPLVSEEKTREIEAALRQRGAMKRCPACGEANLSVLNGYTPIVLNDDPTKLNIDPGMQGIAVANVGCLNCGYVMQHALSIIGIAP